MKMLHYRSQRPLPDGDSLRLARPGQVSEIQSADALSAGVWDGARRGCQEYQPVSMIEYVTTLL